MPRLLDLCSGELGWSKVFAARGWECVCVDLKPPSKPIPARCKFILQDILALTVDDLKAWMIDAAVASTPCEQFSVHGMKHFHPNPSYPELGIKLFNHTRQLCEASGIPYVMENVRAAQQFVGNAVHHCGPFYLWGNAVPPLVPRGIQKGIRMGHLGSHATREELREWRRKHDITWNSSRSKTRQEVTAVVATIPPELSNCVADYAERLLEQKKCLTS